MTWQVDPRVMNKCPTFSRRDTEWSEWSFIFESVAAMAKRSAERITTSQHENVS